MEFYAKLIKVRNLYKNSQKRYLLYIIFKFSSQTQLGTFKLL